MSVSLCEYLTMIFLISSEVFKKQIGIGIVYNSDFLKKHFQMIKTKICLILN